MISHIVIVIAYSVSNAMSDKDARRPDRRTVLKLAGTGVTSVPLIGATSAGGESNGNLNTNFNPDNPRAVRKFVLETKEIGDDEHQRLHQDLSEKQITALREAFRVADIRTERVQSEPDDVSPLRTSETYSQTATSTLGFDLWTIHHDIFWDHNGSSVYNISSRSRAEDHDFTWGYDGTVDYTFDVNSADFSSRRQDKFSSDIYQLTCTPHSELVGTASGNWWVADRNLGGC